MRRKTTNLLVVLLCLLIALLLGLAVFMTWLTGEQADAMEARIRTAQTEKSYSNEDGTLDENLSDGFSADETEDKTHHLIFVGDSRTVGMEEAVHGKNPSDNCLFIGKVGEGFYWLCHEGMEQHDAVLADEPDGTVIFNLGVNDLEEIDRYLEYYPQIFADYPEASFYIMSVNPVGEKCEGTSNEEIKAFNEELAAHFGERYLDCYHYLKQEGFETVDELHYTNDTYRQIHHYAVTTLAAFFE